MTYYFPTIERTQAVSTHLTNAQVDNYLKVGFDVTAENTLIDTLTKTAEEQTEELTNLCVNTKTVTMYATDIETDSAGGYFEFDLPYRGTVTLTSVYYQDSDGDYIVIDAAQYYIKAKNVLIVKWSGTINATNNIRIIYAVSPSNLPIGLDTAMFKLIGDYYTQRTDDEIGSSVYRVTENARQLFLPYQDVKQLM